MTITICTHPQRCTDMEAAHSDTAAQLCAAWVEIAQLKAQLQQSQDATSRLQDALGVAQEGFDVYYGMYKDLSARGAPRNSFRRGTVVSDADTVPCVTVNIRGRGVYSRAPTL